MSKMPLNQHPDNIRTEPGFEDYESPGERRDRLFLEANEMPSYHDAYPSNYIKKEDCHTGVRLTLDRVQMDTIKGDHGPEEVLAGYFAEIDPGWVINKTNAALLEQLFGTDDYDRWRGQIVLWNDTAVVYQGKRGGIRVRMPSTDPALAPDSAKSPEPAQAGGPAPAAATKPQTTTSAPGPPPGCSLKVIGMVEDLAHVADMGTWAKFGEMEQFIRERVPSMTPPEVDYVTRVRDELKTRIKLRLAAPAPVDNLPF